MHALSASSNIVNCLHMLQTNEEQKPEGSIEIDEKAGAERDPDDGRGGNHIRVTEGSDDAAAGQSWTSRWLGWLPSFGQGQQDSIKVGEGAGKDGEPVQEVVVPKDLPLDAIAAEVQVC